MTQELTNPEAEAIAQRIADRAGENTRTYTVMPTITVDNKENVGALIKGIKTEQGYSSEIFTKPFTGVIIKTRMFLKLKFKYAEGKPNVVTNEFESYSDEEIITVKQQDEEKKYQPVFIGNYKQVNDKYSLKSDLEIEKKLELHHAIYVLDMETSDIVRFDSKGLSRSNFFEYMQSFTRRGLDKMSSTFTIFDTEVSDTDYKGKPRKIPIAGITFTKGAQLNLEQLKKLEEIQMEFEKQLRERDILFGNAKPEIASVDQPEPNEELPTINLDKEPEALGLPIDEDEVKLEEIPF